MNEIRIEIPGVPVSKKRCYACGYTKPVSEFHKNRAKKDGFHDECSECANRRNNERHKLYGEKYRKSAREKYHSNPGPALKAAKEYYEKNKPRVLQRMKSHKDTMIDKFYLSIGGAYCRICGYDNSTAALQFHHLDISQKENGNDVLSNWLKIKNKELLRKKLDGVKFTILCANCHIELHCGFTNEFITSLFLKPIKVDEGFYE